MEALAALKAAAGGPHALQAMEQAGTSLEPRLQVHTVPGVSST